jgi:hypothetical protein
VYEAAAFGDTTDRVLKRAGLPLDVLTSTWQESIRRQSR